MTLRNNPGKSFLDVIGPSDVAYIIALLKNSIDVWKYERGGDDTEDNDETTDQDSPKSVPKPLFTRGERVKRKFGKTAWSDEGMEYYKSALQAWKKMFDTRQAFYDVLKNGWDDWLEGEATVLNPNGWTRKDLQTLLQTIPEGAGKSNIVESEMGDGSNAEEAYDSDDEGGPLIGFGIKVDGGTVTDLNFDDNSQYMRKCGGNDAGYHDHEEDEDEEQQHEESYADRDGNESNDEESVEVETTPQARKRRNKKDKSPPGKQPEQKKQKRSTRGKGKGKGK